jgi:hypothetical protein
MRRSLCVGVVLLLIMLLTPGSSSSQAVDSERAMSALDTVQPKPNSTETTIIFTLVESDFVAGTPVVVTMRIRNVLGQIVAFPRTLLRRAGGSVEVQNVGYTTPGPKQAYWKGVDAEGRKVAPGPYLLEVVINGERQPPKTILVGP